MSANPVRQTLRLSEYKARIKSERRMLKEASAVSPYLARKELMAALCRLHHLLGAVLDTGPEWDKEPPTPSC